MNTKQQKELAELSKSVRGCLHTFDTGIEMNVSAQTLLDYLDDCYLGLRYIREIVEKMDANEQNKISGQ